MLLERTLDPNTPFQAVQDMQTFQSPRFEALVVSKKSQRLGDDVQEQSVSP